MPKFLLNIPKDLHVSSKPPLSQHVFVFEHCSVENDFFPILFIGNVRSRLIGLYVFIMCSFVVRKYENKLVMVFKKAFLGP